MSDAITLQTDVDLFGEEVSSASAIDRDALASGLYAQIRDITLAEFVSYFTNGFDAMVDYASLCAGEKTGQRISLLFNPHRLDTGTKRFPISLYAALKDERFVRGLARVVLINKRKGASRDILYASVGMGVQGTSYVQEFPPHVARDLALEYDLTKSSHVLDPCAGWGGRMLGFSAVVDSYTCCEPSQRTAEGLRKLRTFIRSFRSAFEATIFESPFEDVQLQNASYDFALTSPPYYDTELYAPGEPANSFNRYATFDRWCRGFYAPLIHRTMAALKPGGVFVLNIGSRVYPLNDKLFQIADGKYAVEKQKGRLSASNGLGKDGEGETFYEVRRPLNADVVLLDAATLTTVAISDTLNDGTDASQNVEQPQNVDVPAARKAQTSALAFALRAASPLPSDRARDPEQQSSATDAAQVTKIVTQAEALRDALILRGHRLLTRDGKFFVSESSLLIDDDRTAIKLHRDALIALAEPWIESSTGCLASDVSKTIGALSESKPNPVVTPMFFDTPRPTQTLAQFLGSEPSRVDANWTPDEPPDLTGIDEVVLNFATTGIDWAHGHRPVGVTVSTLDGAMTRFLPFAFAGGNLDEATVKRWAERELRGKKITNAKTKFDVHHAREWGIDLEAQGCTFSDIQHTAALLDDHRKRFAIDVLAADYLPALRLVPRVDETRHATHHASEVAERERFTAQLVGKLRDVMHPQIDAQELRAVHDLEDAVIPCVVEMEKNGSPIDMALLERYGAECTAEYEHLMYEISHEAGFAFEHTAKGWKRLLEHLNLDALDSYAESELSQVEHPLVQKGQRAAQYASLNSKIFKAYPEHISDGILRYDINQLVSDEGGTVSGRFSIGIVQQVPNQDNHKEAFGDALFPRRLFVPGNGQYLEADAAQIEFRLLVHYSRNAKLLQAYVDDPHMSFHKTMQTMLQAYKPDMLYAHTKNYNFAAQYGARSIKLAVMMKFITEKQGEEIRSAKRWNDPRLNLIHEIEAAYKLAHPEAGALLDRASHLAKSECDNYCKKGDLLHRQHPHRGYVKTMLGRRSRFPTNYKTYIGLNRILQGTGASIMKKKLVELHEQRKKTGFVMRITNHDAVLGDATEAVTLAKVSAILNAQSYPLKVPILWECATGASWAECK